MPRKDDTHFNEFAFKNSLEATVDKEKIENLYEKGAIGFLATEENLEDEEFVEYIKELMVRFPEVRFKGFVFSDELKEKTREQFNGDGLELFESRSVYDICQNIEIYLSNYERTFANQLENGMVNLLRKYSTDVACLGLGLQRQEITIREIEETNFSYFKPFFDNLEILGFEENDRKKYGTSYHEIYYKKAVEQYGVDIGFDMNETVSKAYVYWNLKLGLHNHEFIKYTLDFGRKFAKLH
jgi:hypothetical protein